MVAQERRVETEIPEWLQPCMEALAWRSTSSTDVSPADVAVPPPAIPLSAHPPAKPNQETSTIYSLIFPKIQTAKYADARKWRACHAKEILAVRRTESR